MPRKALIQNQIVMAKKETTTQELIVANPDLKVSFARFEVIRVQMSEVAKKCLLIKVKDEATLSVCEQNLSKLVDLEKSVETARIKIKEPHLQRCNAIDSYAKIVKGEIPDAIKHLKDEKVAYIKAVEAEKKRKEDIQTSFDSLNDWCSSQITEFTTLKSIGKSITTLESQTEEKIKVKFQERADEAKGIIEKYIKLFNLKKTELESLENASPDEQEAIKAEIQEQTSAIQESVQESNASYQVASFTPTIGKTRRPWKFELTDITKVPLEWLMIDETKVKEWLKNNSDGLKDGGIVNGIKFFKDIKVTA